MIHAYPKIYTIGHRFLKELFNGEVVVEEKIDGSQFAFGLYDGVFKCRSRGQSINPDQPQKLFKEAVDFVKGLNLVDGWTYRGEVVSKPRHNVLAYDRVPRGYVVLFDIEGIHGTFASPRFKQAVANDLGLEPIPVLFQGRVTDTQQIKDIVENTTSVLGGQKIEGVVVKRYIPNVGILIGKFVSDSFKEVQTGKPRAPKETILERLTTRYKTQARWEKALIHLKERGEIEGSERDIGKLMKEVHQDIHQECEEDIKQDLYDWALKTLLRSVVGGLAQWYKSKLAEGVEI